MDACCKAGARFSLAVAVTKTIRAAIETIGPDVWTPIKYTDAVWDEEEERWISDAEIAEVPFTAFTSKKKAFHTTARLIVRRVKRLNPKTVPDGQSQLFAVWRHHVVFTDSVFVLTDAEPMHRAHAAVEQVFADLEDSALAHLPSGKFTANAAWLTLAAAAYNLTRRLPRLRLPCQSADRHHPTAPHPRTGPHRTPGTTDRAAPAPTLALGRRLLRPVDRHRTADAELTNPIPARPRSGRPRRTRHRQRPAGKPTCPEPKIHSETNHTAQSELTRWIEAERRPGSRGRSGVTGSSRTPRLLQGEAAAAPRPGGCGLPCSAPRRSAGRCASPPNRTWTGCSARSWPRQLPFGQGHHAEGPIRVAAGALTGLIGVLLGASVISVVDVTGWQHQNVSSGTPLEPGDDHAETPTDYRERGRQCEHPTCSGTESALRFSPPGRCSATRAPSPPGEREPGRGAAPRSSSGPGSASRAGQEACQAVQIKLQIKPSHRRQDRQGHHSERLNSVDRR
ncbi:hypothetical protein [Streptomyces halstedii]|uniref:hypothetical protein n=1 Tax=Streptomyces halstedii TaxID=1944 RepID=UPI0039C13972